MNNKGRNLPNTSKGEDVLDSSGIIVGFSFNDLYPN